MRYQTQSRLTGIQGIYINYVAQYDGDYENADDPNESSYAAMVAAGMNSIALVNQDGIDITNSDVFQDFAAGGNGGFTESNDGFDAQIAASDVVDNASGNTDTTLIRPVIDFLDPDVTGVSIVAHQSLDYRAEYAQELAQGLAANITNFFNMNNPNSYILLIVGQAALAQSAGATVFDIGTELDPVVTQATLLEWTDLINDARVAFKGQLTYSSSWSHAGTDGDISTIPVAFWKQLDYVGVDAYVLSSDPNDLVVAWTKPPTNSYLVQNNIFHGQSAIDYFNIAAEQTGKPLVITETGYTDASDATTDPLDQGCTNDQFEQAALFKAFYDAWSQAGTTAFVGAYIWDWLPPNQDGTNTTDFTPQYNQAAMDAITTAFAAPDPYLITLSGGTQTIGTVIAVPPARLKSL